MTPTAYSPRTSGAGELGRVRLERSTCAICGTRTDGTERFAATFDESAFSPAVFSARRLPDRIHYRMVACKRCALVRSDPVAPAGTLSHLYRESTFGYGSELLNLRETYGRYLRTRVDPPTGGGSLLEIGCGNGFFLEEALAHGFSSVCGVEPSRAAIADAAPSMRPHIISDVMRAGLFPTKHFDAVCAFHVLDHVTDPADVLRASFAVLKPGGQLLLICHDVDAFSARFLGERSPIVDIEHTFLYSKRTIAQLIERVGFTKIVTGAVENRYSLRYLLHLAPMPRKVRHLAQRLLAVTGTASVSCALPLGNLFAVGCRPAE